MGILFMGDNMICLAGRWLTRQKEGIRIFFMHISGYGGSRILITERSERLSFILIPGQS